MSQHSEVVPKTYRENVDVDLFLQHHHYLDASSERGLPIIQGNCALCHSTASSLAAFSSMPFGGGEDLRLFHVGGSAA